MPPALGRKNNSQTQIQKATGAYLGLAIGDALGASVEFMTPREIQTTYGVHDRIRGGGWLKLKPGQVTDDTTMSLALGQAILSHRALDAKIAAESFHLWMKSKPVDIGSTVRHGISRYRISGQTEAPENEFGAGNGACMRTLPVALACFGLDSESVVRLSRAQAHVTHHNMLSDAATECVIDMIHDSLRGANLEQLRARRAQILTDNHVKFRFDRKRLENPSGYIVDTMKAVFQALFTHHNFHDSLVDVVNRGGDADTTGAIVGMIAGAVYGAESIPKFWIRAMDHSVVQECIAQASDLLGLLNPDSSELTH